MKEFITFVKTLNYTKAANQLFLVPTNPQSPYPRHRMRAGRAARRKAGRPASRSPPWDACSLKKARVIVADFDEMLEECNALARSSTSLTVGFLELPWIEDLFVKARETFCDKHPEATVELAASLRK